MADLIRHNLQLSRTELKPCSLVGFFVICKRASDTKKATKEAHRNRQKR